MSAKSIGAAAPAHRFVDQARDVKSLVVDAGAVHFQERDASGVAADRRPNRKAVRRATAPIRPRPLRRGRRSACAASRTRASTSASEFGWPNPSLSTPMRKPFTPPSSASRITARRDAALARVDAVRSGDHLEQQRIVAHIRGHRPANVERHFERRDAGIGHQAEGRLQSRRCRKSLPECGSSRPGRRRSPCRHRRRRPARRCLTTSRRWCSPACADSAPARSN